ncbi:hypothetical protein SAMD00019534_037820 [Acytostelium subglobosum LB1]|uniref:hypothetical protein n=1 Tax=Acytostelium subglobosum LB1 TaxID=1410327 RepID=UPI000644D7B7|nr:hypothetical protein SAMD00019534_037820 [Acytostelium subglobosum LB1]GAM20607.1 hypothetical protein SAMD00019534_037820 [Acytostelium subglobosum LB1]|eukprot:XP_012760128.1 hypothetical protein SAMD00019534_037820 [Acytostelium subglobosum LB1]
MNFTNIPQQSTQFPPHQLLQQQQQQQQANYAPPKFQYTKPAEPIAKSTPRFPSAFPSTSSSTSFTSSSFDSFRYVNNEPSSAKLNNYDIPHPLAFFKQPMYQSPDVTCSPMDVSYFSPSSAPSSSSMTRTISNQQLFFQPSSDVMYQSRSIVNLLTFFPEEILITILSHLNVSDLHNCIYVCKNLRRLCEDEFIFKNICQFNYPCLNRYVKPPFESTWRRYYNQRKTSFLVLGGPVAQSSCMDDICSKLRAAGIDHVDSFYTQKRIPTLEELQKYSGVLIYSYNSSAFLDGQLMGDVMADYVDNGGGVVVTVFTNCNNLRNGFLKGRFFEQNYHPINPARQHDTNGKKPLSLGKVVIPDHPIMNDVKSLEGGRSSFFCPGSLHPDATLVAEWSNNVPLIAELPKNKGKVVALNFFPPSSDTGDGRFWSSSTDGAVMMANALAYVGRSAALKKHKQMIEGASYFNDRVKDGEGANRFLHDKDVCSQRKGSPKEKKHHKFLGKRIPLLFKLFSKRLTPI